MSDLVEVLGLACITVAAFVVAVALGWLVAGLALMFVAQGLEGTVTVVVLGELFGRIPRPHRREQA